MWDQLLHGDLDLKLLRFAKTLQCRGKGEPSDFTVASTVVSMHESLDAHLAKERGIRLHPLTVKRLDRLTVSSDNIGFRKISIVLAAESCHTQACFAALGMLVQVREQF